MSAKYSAAEIFKVVKGRELSQEKIDAIAAEVLEEFESKCKQPFEKGRVSEQATDGEEDVVNVDRIAKMLTSWKKKKATILK